MNKYLLKYMVFCFIAMLSVSCNDSESDLLEPKVYFEEREYRIEVEEGEAMTHELRTRRYLFPIPQGVINANPALSDADQNPEW